MPQAANHVDVKAAGATGNGKAFDTKAIQAAIDACAKQGGGTIAFRPGVYLCAPLRLASNITLNLQAGAVLLGSPDIEDRVLDGWPAGMFYAKRARNVTITGRGTIDGNYRHFFHMKRVIPATYYRDFDPKRVRGGKGFAGRSVDGPVEPKKRPGNMLVFSECENVLVEGVTITGSTMWTVHVADSRGVTFRDLDLTSDQKCYNNDGIHLTDCKNVVISGCRITTGDDCIAMSGQKGQAKHRLEAGSEPEIALGFSGLPGASENVVVSDCVLSSKSSAVRIWSLQTPVRHVRLSNLIVRNTNRGIGIFLRSEESISDVTISGVELETRYHTGAWWGWAEPLHISAMPLPGKRLDRGRIERIRVFDLSATAENGMVFFSHLPGVIRDISMENIRLLIKTGKHSALKAGHLDLRNTLVELGITQRMGTGLTAVNVDSLSARNVHIQYDKPFPPHMAPGPQLDGVRDLSISDFRERYL
jgi:hypothetical protein